MIIKEFIEKHCSNHIKVSKEKALEIIDNFNKHSDNKLKLPSNGKIVIADYGYLGVEAIQRDNNNFIHHF